MKEQAIEVVPCPNGFADMFHVLVDGVRRSDENGIYCMPESEANTKADSLRAAQEPTQAKNFYGKCKGCERSGSLDYVLRDFRAARSKQSEPEPWCSGCHNPTDEHTCVKQGEKK